MGPAWRAAPRWLKVLGVLGIPWFLVGIVAGLPLLLTEGDGMALVWVGLLGVTPWLAMLRWAPQDRADGDAS